MFFNNVFQQCFSTTFSTMFFNNVFNNVFQQRFQQCLSTMFSGLAVVDGGGSISSTATGTPVLTVHVSDHESVT